MYTIEYDDNQVLFGAGFDYLGRYADSYRQQNEYWLNNVRVDYDYPHNPLLSALLSGGMLGFAALLSYMIITAWSYFRTWPTTAFFAIWQGILLLFVFFSGNTIFSTPWFIMVAFVPTITQHLKDDKATNQQQIMPACRP